MSGAAKYVSHWRAKTQLYRTRTSLEVAEVKQTNRMGTCIATDICCILGPYS